MALFIFRPMADMILRRTHELVDARNSMAFIAVHDGLTGLHNRTFLTDHFDTLIKGAHRRGERLAVLQLDLDRFKQINDTLGHAAGDYVLVVTAQRMRDSCRASDLCVRLGGDEFVMILAGAGSGEDINTVAKRILARINEPINFHGATILPGASAGIAVYPIDADNAKDLIVHADLALYSAKKLGGGGFSFFSDELRQELDHRKQLERDLKIAIAERAFERLLPAAGLAQQWRHHRRRSAGALEPCAARHDLARRIHPGRRKIGPDGADRPHHRREGDRRSCRMAQRRHLLRPPGDQRVGHRAARAGLRHLPVRRRWKASGLPPEKLSLEIVESVILDDEKTGIAAKLRHIRAAGVHLELDDFGTGYASLSHVNPNEIDRLKIDRRFVQNINLNGDNSKIVKAITELARGLGISIIAEGAETEAELNSLLSIGCDQVQGYSIAFPMPDGQAREWLAMRGPKKPQLQGARRQPGVSCRLLPDIGA